MDSVCLWRVLEGEGRAWGSCAGAHRGVLSFGHFFGREGLLDESLWSRDPHLLEKRGDPTCRVVRRVTQSMLYSLSHSERKEAMTKPGAQREAGTERGSERGSETHSTFVARSAYFASFRVEAEFIACIPLIPCCARPYRPRWSARTVLNPKCFLLRHARLMRCHASLCWKPIGSQFISKMVLFTQYH